jgi:hypothetical protein
LAARHTDWAWGLPLIVLNVVLHLLGIGLMNDVALRLWSSAGRLEMHEGKPIIGAARPIVAICIATVILAIAPLCGAFAAKVAPAAGEGAATSPKVHELVVLLADPTVQEWLKQEEAKKSAAEPAPESAENSVSYLMDARLGAIREHIVALSAAVPDLPNQFERAVSLLQAESQFEGPSCCWSLCSRVWALASSGCIARRRRRHASASTVSLWRL